MVLSPCRFCPAGSLPLCVSSVALLNSLGLELHTELAKRFPFVGLPVLLLICCPASPAAQLMDLPAPTPRNQSERRRKAKTFLKAIALVSSES
jgi:hypothetical protein